MSAAMDFKSSTRSEISTEYVLGHEDNELYRLMVQGRLLASITEQAIRLAGVESGMRVIDAGCGAGDVSLLLATIVGPEGQVIAVDSANEAVAKTLSRADQAGFSNIHGVIADLAHLDLGAPVDAVVGRLILMHVSDPPTVIQNLARQVRAGGLVHFLEIDLHGVVIEPEVALARTWIDRVIRTFENLGLPTRPGFRLADQFAAAGLPWPSMQLFGRVELAPALESTASLVTISEALKPAMMQFGIASESDFTNLKARLEADITQANAVVLTPPLVSAWTRVPVDRSRS